jgi:hypothetical protein
VRGRRGAPSLDGPERCLSIDDVMAGRHRCGATARRSRLDGDQAPLLIYMGLRSKISHVDVRVWRRDVILFRRVDDGGA